MAKAKEIEGLNCGAEAREGISLVLETRLGEVLEHRAAVFEGDGVDGVHDMRVASRRLRSALRDFRPYMNAKRLEDAAEELKRVADALGRVRDLDVAVLALKELAAEAPEDVRAGVEAFARERREKKERERAALAEELTEEHLAALRERFSHDLAKALKVKRRRRKDEEEPPPAQSFIEAGEEIIEGRWQELRERCRRSIHRPFKVNRLHKARIAAKQLRYALELFAQCEGREHFKERAREVERMQKSLGDLHDCDEWITSFGRWLSEHDAREAMDKDHAEQHAAAVWLLQHFIRERTRHYSDALARWHEWECEGFEPQAGT